MQGHKVTIFSKKERKNEASAFIALLYLKGVLKIDSCIDILNCSNI
jgi:hypothetical protein